MADKLGVYVCSGCGIGDALDVEALCNVGTKDGKAAVCKSHAFLCGEEGAALIKSDIENEGINGVVIAACSLRVKVDVFQYDAPVFLERVNIREHVIWCHPANDEDTQMLAEDYLRMGCARAQKAVVPEPFQEEIDKTILVVGGGISGMTAALETARAGYDVCLVEKESALGGMLNRLHKLYPKTPPYREPEDTGLEARIKEIEDNPKIKVFTGTEVEKTEGAPGMYDVTLKSGETFRIGSIIQATGFKPYDATKLEHLGYGKSPDVITNLQMEDLARTGKITRPSDGKDARSVAFIQCAGQRDPDHLPYCSSICCMTSLKQALYVTQQSPEAEAYIFYKDIRTPAQYEDFYKRVQEEPGIFMVKGDVQNISEDGGKLTVEVHDSLLGEDIAVNVDLVVLATGLVSNSNPDVVKMEIIGEAKEETPVPEDSGRYAEPALNLQYRQGPELPTLKYGLPDSHFICFPYETRRTGIYAAGCVRQPEDTASCMDDATGAALKAIQCVEQISRGLAVHPRTWDKSYPDLYMSRCTQCKRCTEECPFGMYNEDEKANPLPNPTRCRRCAICLGSCPERIISFADYSVDIIGSMLKAIEVPEEDEEKPRVLAFMCENDAYPAMDMTGINRIQYNPWIRAIPLRCLGSMNLIWLNDAFNKGFDGVLLIGCVHGDDYQCHYVKGSELAEVRSSKIQETLQRMMLEGERVEVHQLQIDEWNKLPQIFDDFMKVIERIGPNPMKEF
ncbi:MAG: heterodisulfide reductase subunit A [Chloroflexi bacterium]|nr:MAG: heterodisulfide reductase subunit A [Chloroflexota bacterium]